MNIEGLGKHCAVSDCHQLDFLPFTCDSCGVITCLEHYPYAAHECTQSSQKDVQAVECPICNQVISADPRDAAEVNAKVYAHINSGCSSHVSSPRSASTATNRCNAPSCKNKPLVPLTCKQCHRKFCTSHRFPDDHACASVRRAQQASASARRGIWKSPTPAQAKIAASGSTSKLLKPDAIMDPKKAKKAAQLNLMLKKSKAVGNGNIPPADRFYVDFKLPHDASKAGITMYFTKSTGVGRVLDAVADAAGVTNNNNVPGAERLVLVNERTGEPLPLDGVLEFLVVCDLLIEGETVVLQRVPAPPAQGAPAVPAAPVRAM